HEFMRAEAVVLGHTAPVGVDLGQALGLRADAFAPVIFMNYSEMVGAEAYVSGNVGSASPSEMAEWVEYMTFPSKSTYAEERRKNGRDKP
ncbi:hypothetical protein ACCS63_35680, partial [Rhizobium brockwellii]